MQDIISHQQASAIFVGDHEAYSGHGYAIWNMHLNVFFQHCEIVCKNVLHLLTLEMAWINARTHPASGKYVGGFLKCWYPTTFGFPTKNDHFRVFWGYHHLRKHPYRTHPKRFGGFVRPTLGAFMGVRRLEPASSCRTREGGVPPAHCVAVECCRASDRWCGVWNC